MKRSNSIKKPIVTYYTFKAKALIGAGIVTSIAIGVGLLNNAFEPRYYVLIDLLLGSCSLLIAAFLGVFLSKKISICEDEQYLVQSTMLKSEKIEFNEIKGIVRYFPFGNRRNGETIEFVNEKKLIRVNSFYTKNFREFLKLGNRNFKKEKKENAKYPIRERRVFRNIFLLLSIFCFFIFFQIQFDDGERLKADLVEYEMVLSAKPQKKKRSSGRYGGSYRIEILDKNNSEFYFNLTGYSYDNSNKERLLKLNSGDPVTVLILNDDFEFKIKDLKEATFWKKHTHWNTIQVYGLSYYDEQMLNPEYVIKDMEDDGYSWFVLAFGLFFLLISLGNILIEKVKKLSLK